MEQLTALAQFWNTYGAAIILTVGAATAALGAVLGWRWFRHGEAHKRTGTLAVVLATAFSAEGMWEVARESLHLQIHIALVLFAMFEIVMVNQGLLAKHKLQPEVPGSPRKHMVFVWLIAFATGGIASTNSDNLTEFCLRLVAPSVAAGIWWTTLTADGIAKAKDAVTWRWSVRRILLAIGAIEAGDVDVIAVQRERQLGQLIDLTHQRRLGKLSTRQRRKLSKLERHATDDMLDEVVRRIDRSAWFTNALDTPAPLTAGTPAAAPAPPAPSPAEPPTAPVPAPLSGTPINGSGTPVPAPSNGSGTGAAAPPPNGAGTPAQRISTPTFNTPAPRANGTGAGTPAPPVTSGGTPDSTPEDEVLLTVLRDPARVPREPDGTVPIKRAIKVLGVGRPRAMRLLDIANLRRYPDPDDGASTPGTEGSGTGADDEDRHPAPLNGHRPLALTGA